MPAAAVVGDGDKLVSNPGKVVLGELQSGKRVCRCGIESGRDDQQLRVKIDECRNGLAMKLLAIGIRTGASR